MFGGHLVVGCVKLLDSVGRIAERLLRGDRSILVDVRRVVLQRCAEETAEHRGIAFLTTFSRRDHRSAITLERFQHRAARAAGHHDQLMPGARRFKPERQFLRAEIRSRNVETKTFSVIGAVTDEQQHQSVVGAHALKNFVESHLHRCAIRRFSQEQGHIISDFAQLIGRRSGVSLELQLVVLLAAEPGHD